MLLFNRNFSDDCSEVKKEKDQVRKRKQRAKLCPTLVEKTKIYDRKKAAKRRLNLKAQASKVSIKKETTNGQVCSPGTFAKFVDRVIEIGSPSKKVWLVMFWKRNAMIISWLRIPKKYQFLYFI